MGIQRSFVIIGTACLAFVVSGCGSSSSSSPTYTPATTTVPASTNYPSATHAPAATPAGTAASTVKVATATVATKSESVLTTAAGLTLYYLTSDTTTAPKCTGTCLSNWPPLLSAGPPPSGTGLTGTLTVAKNANGSQVAYNGHLLYRFASDVAKGDVKGEGIAAFGGVWHAATPGLAIV